MLITWDRVVWFNLGSHHVPHTGDIPNTLMTTSASSVLFVPHNYHLSDRSRSLTRGVHAEFQESTGKWNLNTLAPTKAHSYNKGIGEIRKLPAIDKDISI